MSQSEIIGTSTATGIDYNKVLVTTEGSLRIEKKLYRQNARLLNIQNLAPLELWATSIDCRLANSISLMGTALDGFVVYGSIDDTNYFSIITIFPDSNVNHPDMFYSNLINPPPYIKIHNGSTANTITLDYSISV
tara:strand:+ start:329 stop:733 length:405 start_codon:yes stop_codon:yes gene_type:complete